MRKRGIKNEFFQTLDKLYRAIDKKQIRRTKNIRLIPDFANRRGGKLSYAEWAHVIGIFQTVFYQNLEKKEGNHFLDVGCGTGLLGLAAQPLTSNKGTYTGIDVMEYDVNYCKKNYPFDNYQFIHFDISNPTYAAKQSKELKPWPIENESKDMVTALSVWTHLSEEDAVFYLKEVGRVLKKGGKAMITFFVLDESYQESLEKRKDALGRFHSTSQLKWIFDQKAYDSTEWFTPKWSKNPEDAIGLTNKGMQTLLEGSGLKIKEYLPGNWKEAPGVYFQDIVVFEKT